MSSEEISETIKAKYPPLDQQTYGETQLMMSEMREANIDDRDLYGLILGVVDMLRRTHFNSTLTHTTYSPEEQISFTQNLMDEKLDPSAIGFEYNARKYAGLSVPATTVWHFPWCKRHV